MIDILAFFNTNSKMLRDFHVQHDSMVTTISARYDAFKKDSKTPAARFVELRIERNGFQAPQLCWRTGYLYNDRAIFRIVPNAHRQVWLTFADQALRAVRYEATEKIAKVDDTLQLLGIR